ncbi:hypothetical protein BH09ACT7_BH09ACT7_08450 [soil metagenome]
MMRATHEPHTDKFLYRRYCEAIGAIHPGAHVVRCGDRVTVVLDTAGSGWSSSWPGERARFAAGGGAS